MAQDIPSTICILGCGGFIGSHLTERILSTTNHRVIGVDMASSKICHLLGHDRFDFANANVFDTLAISKMIVHSNVVISLAALCNPSLYNTVPLDVIESNFTKPLELVKMCCEMEKWLIHFSTCEVYGKTISNVAGIDSDNEHYYLLKEDESPMIVGPIGAQRWSYSSAKQLLERLIYAYGFEQGLKYTIVRPFNFIGPRMDYLPGIDGEGIPRVLACFMDALLFNKPIKLVDGGKNRRCFTYIDDAVDAIMAMLTKPEKAQSQIFNIGNPTNEVSIAELANNMIELYRELQPDAAAKKFAIESVDSKEFYGVGYEDSDRRVPDISKARSLLGWKPQTCLSETLRRTMEEYIAAYSKQEVTYSIAESLLVKIVK